MAGLPDDSQKFVLFFVFELDMKHQEPDWIHPLWKRVKRLQVNQSKCYRKPYIKPILISKPVNDSSIRAWLSEVIDEERVKRQEDLDSYIGKVFHQLKPHLGPERHGMFNMSRIELIQRAAFNNCKNIY